MTRAQRRVLAIIDSGGPVHGADMPTDTRNALIGLGLIEELDAADRGLRNPGWFRLTTEGRRVVAAQKSKGESP